MASSSTLETITCPHCGQEGSFARWHSVNTQTEPELKDKVRNGEAFQFHCGHCGKDSYFDYGFLYHQMEDSLMIFYAQTEDEYKEALSACLAMRRCDSGDEKADALMKKIYQHYLFRIVFSHDQFMEKLITFDAGLDDRLTELMKAIYCAHIVKDRPDLDIMEARVGRDASGMFLHFYEGAEDSEGKPFPKKVPAVSIPFNRSVYDHLEQTCAAALPAFRTGEDFIVDIRWAADFLKSHPLGKA